MSGGEEREPLWASALADQPERGGEPFFEEPAVPDAPPAPAGLHLRPVGLGVMAGLALALLASAALARGSLVIEEVPSAWGDTPMSCNTARLEENGRAIELFHCRATGTGSLPPGVYRSPASQWTSDLTRIDASASEILISPEGVLAGLAVY